MKKLSLTLSLLLLFAGGVSGNSEKDISLNALLLIHQGTVDKAVEQENRYDNLRGYKAWAEVYISPSPSNQIELIGEDGSRYIYSCKNMPDLYYKRYLYESQSKETFCDFVSHFGLTPKELIVMRGGYRSQAEANDDVLYLCESQKKALCFLFLEGENFNYARNEYTAYRNAGIEEAEHEAFMTQMIDRCEGFGFEGDQQIAACIQQEVFNEKKLALQKQELLESRKQLAEQKSNKSYLQMLNGLANLSNVLLQQKVTKQRKEIQRQNKCRRLESQGSGRCIK